MVTATKSKLRNFRPIGVNGVQSFTHKNHQVYLFAAPMKGIPEKLGVLSWEGIAEAIDQNGCDLCSPEMVAQMHEQGLDKGDNHLTCDILAKGKTIYIPVKVEAGTSNERLQVISIKKLAGGILVETHDDLETLYQTLDSESSLLFVTEPELH